MITITEAAAVKIAGSAAVGVSVEEPDFSLTSSKGAVSGGNSDAISGGNSGALAAGTASAVGESAAAVAAGLASGWLGTSRKPKALVSLGAESCGGGVFSTVASAGMVMSGSGIWGGGPS